tara:strand:+ start:618 stop:2300 length:1683 start_codon:yes stop_codon:yes gene_type:complete
MSYHDISTAPSSTIQRNQSDLLINNFIIDTSVIDLNGGTRNFNIIGTSGAIFNLQITTVISNAVYYYNFKTNLLQTTPTELIQKISGNYSGSITIPKASAALKFEFLLLADFVSGTRHAPYNEARGLDGNVDVNASKGSNSLILKKVIHQVTDAVLTITPASINALTGFTSASVVSDTITIVGNASTNKIPFSISISSANGRALEIDRDAEANDFTVGVNKVIGNTFVITGENVFGAGQAVRSTDKVVAGQAGFKITMDDDVGALWAIGDRITGNAQLDSLTGVDAVTITDINVSGNAKALNISNNVEIEVDETLTFTEPHHFGWSVSDAYNLTNGISVIGGNVVAGTTLAPYIETETILEGTRLEEKIVKVKLKSAKPTVVPVFSASSRGGARAIAEGDITFNKPQPLVLAGDTVAFYAYGNSNIKTLTGWDVEVTDLVTTLTKPTTTTASATINGTSVAVVSGHGIMDDVSTVSSINMDASVVNPTVTNIGSYTVASAATATLTLSSAQTLEAGETLTFDNAGQTITITGNIKINTVSDSVTLNLDVEKFITATIETA